MLNATPTPRINSAVNISDSELRKKFRVLDAIFIPIPVVKALVFNTAEKLHWCAFIYTYIYMLRIFVICFPEYLI